MFYRLCRVREISPGTHTFFPTYTCPVYCWRSVQLLDFGLCCNLIHASQPIRTTFTGQCFAYGFLQTSPHSDALAFSCILPTAGRIRDFHPLERAPAGRTTKTVPRSFGSGGLFAFLPAVLALSFQRCIFRLLPSGSVVSLLREPLSPPQSFESTSSCAYALAWTTASQKASNSGSSTWSSGWAVR